MILYNLRYRGPYEYDKYMLNAMQLANQTRSALKNLGDGSIASFSESAKKLNEIYEELSSPDGLPVQALLLSRRERFN